MRTIKWIRGIIDRYNDIGYGKCEIFDVKQYYILSFYNAGFSENEEIDSYFEINKPHYVRLVINDHPMHIYVIHKKLSSNYNRRDKNFRFLSEIDFLPLQEIAIKKKNFIYKYKVIKV